MADNKIEFEISAIDVVFLYFWASITELFLPLRQATVERNVT